MASSQPVLQFDVQYPERSSRLLNGLMIIKWIAIIPHYIVLYFLEAVVGVTTILAWFAILFTGRYPRGLFNFALMFLRWQTCVSAYLMLMRDEYPPFGDGAYPVMIELDYPERLSRWKIFFKILFAIPHFIVLYILGAVAAIVTFIAWLAIIFTGAYPRGMFNFNVGVLRWSLRLQAYLLLMTDAYPPFTMAPVPSPTTGYATGAA
jgi:hypothetical protein